jgi:hypothetical protein
MKLINKKLQFFLKILCLISGIILNVSLSLTADNQIEQPQSLRTSILNTNKLHRNINKNSPKSSLKRINTDLLVNTLDSQTSQYRRQNMPLQFKCTYLIIDKNVLGKSENSNYFYRIFQIETGRVDLNLNYFKTYTDNCFDEKIIENLETLAGNRSTLFGVDLSSNGMDDTKFEMILNTNPLFKYRSNLIRFLNLSDNSLSRMSSSKSKNDLVDEFAFLNELNVKISDAWYLLSRFSQLETLILDGNVDLQMFDLGILSFLMKKLKVFSLNRCNLNKYNLNETKDQRAIGEAKFFYMGLSRNKLGEMETSDLTRLIEVLVPSVVENLDFSSNKFTKLELSFGKRSLTRLNFEKNLIGSFNVNEFLEINSNMVKFFELNLRNNFIRNLNVDNFRIKKNSKATRISIKLKHNPLLCDCNSMWLFEEMKKYKLYRSKTNLRKFTQTLNSKVENTNENESNIKLIFKREIEEISSHHNLNDPNFDEYMQRQKRIKFQQEFDQTDQTWVKKRIFQLIV